MKIKIRYTETRHVGEHTSGFSCLANGCLSHDVRAILTTEHACSSYGIPVCVAEDGRVLTAQELSGVELYKAGCDAALTSIAADAYVDEIVAARQYGYNIL